jgi:carbon storage regulator
MLILQRRVGQRIVIAGGVEITVAAVTKSGIRLAVSAPKGVSVLRGEVHDAIVAANETAASYTVDLEAIDAAAAGATAGKEAP